MVDTNVISEPLRAVPSRLIEEWFERQDRDTLYTAATSQAELLVGFAMMPEGARRAARLVAAAALIDDLFPKRVLPFDSEAARHYPELVARARRSGRIVGAADAQIAAIAAVHGFTVATRDTAPFLAMGIPVVDPWHPDA